MPALEGVAHIQQFAQAAGEFGALGARAADGVDQAAPLGPQGGQFLGVTGVSIGQRHVGVGLVFAGPRQRLGEFIVGGLKPAVLAARPLLNLGSTKSQAGGRGAMVQDPADARQRNTQQEGQRQLKHGPPPGALASRRAARTWRAA
mmetsp:Transcript_6086/g.24466  ORF Transcript_6086/g.24466 Transcript_6086/m.24466 type:complete len:146 (+) Transcript_6086:2610-3047(+)